MSAPLESATPGSWMPHLVILGLLAVLGLMAVGQWEGTAALREDVHSGDATRMARALPILAMRGDPQTFTPALLAKLRRSNDPAVRELSFCDELTRYVEIRLIKRALGNIQDQDELRRCKFWMKKLGTHKINLTLQGLRMFLNAMDETEVEPEDTD